MQMLRNIRWVMIAALTLAPVVAYGEPLQNITVSSGGTKIATASGGSETGGQVTLSGVNYADFKNALGYLQKSVTLTATGATTKANFKQNFTISSISGSAMKLSGSALVPPRPSTPAPALPPKQ
jgi:hypothetical protein